MREMQHLFRASVYWHSLSAACRQALKLLPDNLQCATCGQLEEDMRCRQVIIMHAMRVIVPAIFASVPPALCETFCIDSIGVCPPAV